MIEYRVLDTTFKDVLVVDTFDSILWTDRYSGSGDFEISSHIDAELLLNAHRGAYIISTASDHIMIVEDIVIETDAEMGNRMYVSGRSAESILNRRIIWTQTNISGNLQNGILKLLNENLINPTDTNRKVDNFIFEASTEPYITDLTLDAQFTGDNLYEVIKVICDVFGLGFQVTLNEENKFVFKLYVGKDHSYEQQDNPYVIFSPEYDNILSSNYYETDKNVRNIALIAGEGEGLSRRTATIGEGVGLDRRELFVDARDISSDTEDGTLTEAEYTKLLQQRGEDSMAENILVQSFEGEAEVGVNFVLGIDFNIGDIVQLRNEYGLESSTRVTEVIFSHDLSGTRIVPTFSIV